MHSFPSQSANSLPSHTANPWLRASAPLLNYCTVLWAAPAKSETAKPNPFNTKVGSVDGDQWGIWSHLVDVCSFLLDKYPKGEIIIKNTAL